MGARLVRDRIGEVDWKVPEAKALLRPVRSHTEHLRLLNQKILEEVGELLSATTPAEVETEAADVLEALVCAVGLRGGNWEAVLDRAFYKRQKLGGFEGGTVWET